MVVEIPIRRGVVYWSENRAVQLETVNLKRAFAPIV